MSVVCTAFRLEVAKSIIAQPDEYLFTIRIVLWGSAISRVHEVNCFQSSKVVSVGSSAG